MRAPGAVVRIGVTGHRVLADADRVAASVDELLDDVLDDGAPVEIWSSLADGADRLVARRGLARGRSTLVAVLPLAPEEYREDFTDASCAEFDDLLAASSHVIVTGRGPSGTRESAYERAGRAIVDACDVLVALWDGEESRGRGGTAEIVAYAREHGCDVRVIPVERA